MPYRRFADRSPYLFRYYYYLIGNFIAQREIKTLLKDSSVICDWYIFSTIAFHSVLLNKRLNMPNMFMPHKLIYLSATREQIEARLQERQYISKFENLDFLENVKNEYERVINNFPNLIRVDTTGKTVEASVNEILTEV